MISRGKIHLKGPVMKLKVLVGAGSKVMGFTLPFIVAGIVLNILFPAWFTLGFGTAGVVVGVILLVIGVPVWISSVVLILVRVPQKKLITTGPFAVVLHPLYTSVALLVIPGIGLLFDSWVGAAIGVVLYISSRIFSPGEEKLLLQYFPNEYPRYREKVLLPWL
jgi:protein-S-isoprenylcysteine O-methyltransferase Ste14